MNRIAIVTPVKDELENLSKIIKSIESQSIRIFLWIIVENDSIDGSAEYLKSVQKVNNVDIFHVLTLNLPSKDYDIGFKYSKVVQHGFSLIKELECYSQIDFIGILDADCFPEVTFYEKLVQFMSENNSGLVSGVLVDHDGCLDISNDDNIRGTGRLWHKKCFDETGFYYGLSPDAITQRKAEILGWNPKVVKDAYFYSRKAGKKHGYADKYYEFLGKSAYYNGHTLLYVVLKSIYYVLNRERACPSYIKGYISSYLSGSGKNPDVQIINYNKRYIYKLIAKRVRGKRRKLQ